MCGVCRLLMICCVMLTFSLGKFSMLFYIGPCATRLSIVKPCLLKSSVCPRLCNTSEYNQVLHINTSHTADTVNNYFHPLGKQKPRHKLTSDKEDKVKVKSREFATKANKACTA